MDGALATQILVAAKEHNVFKEDMPEDEALRIDKAERVVRQANAARNAGVKAPAVLAVMSLVDATPTNGASAEHETSVVELTPPPVAEAPETPELPPMEADAKPAPVEAMQARRGGFNPEGRKGFLWECPDCDYACGSERGLKMHAKKTGHRTSLDQPEPPAILPSGEHGDEQQSPATKPAPEPEVVTTPEPEAASAQIADIDAAIKADDTLVEEAPADKSPEPPVAEAPPASLHEAVEYVHTQRALARIGETQLPMPADFSGDPPQRPEDMSGLAPAELRKLHSQFNACSAYARFQVALEDTKADDAKRVMARKRAQVMESLNPLNEQGKPKPVTMLENEAFNTSPELQTWGDRMADHLAAAKILRAMLESYDLDCARISREISMRDHEGGGQ